MTWGNEFLNMTLWIIGEVKSVYDADMHDSSQMNGKMERIDYDEMK